MQEKAIRTSLVSQVYDFIINMIRSGELQPGDRLNINELAERFGVSRTPVRETVNRLIQEGYAEQQHNVGPRITLLDINDELDLIDANEGLFRLVIESYKELENLDDLIGKLEDVLKEQQSSKKDDDADTFHKASVGFHLIMIDACTNSVIREFARTTQNKINMSTLSFQATEANRQDSIDGHTAILKALKAGNLDEAKEQMTKHNIEGRTKRLQMYENK